MYSQDLIKVVDGAPGGNAGQIIIVVKLVQNCWNSCVLTDHYQLLLLPFGGFCILQNITRQKIVLVEKQRSERSIPSRHANCQWSS